jgi:hypothetical protein
VNSEKVSAGKQRRAKPRLLAAAAKMATHYLAQAVVALRL